MSEEDQTSSDDVEFSSTHESDFESSSSHKSNLETSSDNQPKNDTNTTFDDDDDDDDDTDSYEDFDDNDDDEEEKAVYTDSYESEDDSKAAVSALINQIDQGLSRYYAHRKHSYADDDGNNKFIAFCEANGFDDNDINEELVSDADECMILDFDENFPFPEDIKPQEKNKFVFDILVLCFRNPKAFTEENDPVPNITVHSESNTFTYYITAKLNEIDEKIFVEFLDEIKIKFNIKDKVGKIYEDVSGKRNYCYDLDDLVEMLRDKMKNVVNDNSKVLHLHIEPELDTWCRSNGFAKYYNKLKEFGFSSPDEFIEQSQEDVDELCDELEMKYAVKNKLKQAINAVHKEKEEQNKPSQRDFSIVQHTKKQYIVPKSIGIASKTLCASWNSQSLKHPGISHLKQELKHVESKTMLVIGQTGAGKTTLINGMMNYIYNIKYEDNYRLRLIEEKEKQSLQAESQTDHVSVYQVSKPEFDSNIDYDLNIIDTPGFGDTRGILKDAEILVDLTYLLDNTLNGIDAICFVMKSTTNRLTSAQQYVFNSVLNLWSKDIEPNMFILLTFCEGKNAQIINSLVQHPQFSSCKNIFQFNNSAYCHDPTDIKSQDDDMDGLSDQFNKIYWKMSENGFKSFFKVLNDTKPKSTINSRNVLRQRAKIDNKIEIILNEKDNLLHQTQKIVQYQRLIGKYDDDIEYNEDTTQITKHMDMVKEYKNFNTITNCNHCNKTCHSDCKKSDIKNCNVMNEDRCCKICGCHWSEHTNNNYIWVRKQIINKTTNLDIKIKYDTALKNKNKTQNEIQQLLSHKQEIENN
eukprot:446437_1